MQNNSNTQTAAAVGSRPLTSGTGDVLTTKITIRGDKSVFVREFFQWDGSMGHASNLLDLLESYIQSRHNSEGELTITAQEIANRYFQINQIIKLIQAVEPADNVLYPDLFPSPSI